MKISVDFPVITIGTVKQRPPKKTVVAQETVHVDIPEYSASEAHIVMTTTRRRGDPNSGKRYMGKDGVLFESAPYVQIEDGRVRYRFGYDITPQSGDMHRHLDLEIFELLNRLKKMHSTAIVSAIVPSSLAELRIEYDKVAKDRRTVELPTITEIKLGAFDEDAVRRQVDSFKQHLSRFIMIDGKMQISTSEPIYSISLGQDGVVQPHISTIDRSYPGRLEDSIPSMAAVGFFRADASHDEMTDEVNRLRAVLDFQEQQPVDILGRIHVNDPSYLGFDPEGATLRLAARRTLKGFIGDLASKMNPFTPQQLAHLLLTLPTGDFNAYRDLEGAMACDDREAIANSLPYFGKFHKGFGRRATQLRSEAMISAVIERWENRPINGNDLRPTFQPA